MVENHACSQAEGSALTRVGAILRFLVCGSSCSGSCAALDSLFPSVTAVAEFGTLAADIGVIGGVDSGRFTEPVFEAVTPGTVPIVGVGEFPMTGAVGGTCEDCVATEDTEFDRDLLGLAVVAFGVGDAKLAPLVLGIREKDGAAEPVGVGRGDGWAELLVPIDNEC